MDARGLFKTKHLLLTALVTALSFGALGGVVGFAQASDEQEQMPSIFGVREPALGDQVVYNGTIVRDEPISVDVHIAREEVVTFRDRHGALVLAEYIPLWGLYELGTGRFLGHGDGWSETSAEVQEGDGPLATSQTVHRFELRAEAWFPLEDERLCWLHNGLQGAQHPTDEALQLFAPCIFDPGHDYEIPEDVSFRAVGYEEGALVMRGHSPSLSIEAHFRPDVPYPTFVEVEHHERAQRLVYRMVSFSPGELGLPAAATLDLAPPVRHQEAAPWGMDDAHIGHPFPPSAAYQKALEEPTWTVLKEWAALHPGHMPMEMEYHEGRYNEEHHQTWSMELTDGSSILDLRVTRIDFAKDLVELPPRYEFQGSSDASPGLEAPLPSMWPTAESLQARWKAYNHEAVRPLNLTHWRIDWLPVGAGVEPVLLIGHETHPEWGRFGFQPQTVDDVELEMGVRFDGTALYVRQDAGRESTEENWITDAATDPPGKGGEPDAPEIRPASGNAWVVPTRERAATVGGFAAVVGLGFWLYPLLKGMPALGLFSRIRRPQMLGHPQRRALVDAIEATPGIHFAELLRQQNISNGSAVHHLRKLTEAGLIKERRDGGFTCYFPAGAGRQDMAAAPVLKSSTARRILDTIQGCPGITGKEVASHLGIAPATANHHIKRLELAGVLSAHRQGRSIALTAA